jgi:hypothetical protein
VATDTVVVVVDDGGAVVVVVVLAVVDVVGGGDVVFVVRLDVVDVVEDAGALVVVVDGIGPGSAIWSKAANPPWGRRRPAGPTRVKSPPTKRWWAPTRAT